MEPENLSKCNNCGAPLVQGAAKNLKCPYCGSDYLSDAGDRAVTRPSPAPNIPSGPAKPQNNNGGCAVAFAILVLLAIGGALIANNSESGKASYADSLAIDTVTRKADDIESPKKEDSPIYNW